MSKIGIVAFGKVGGGKSTLCNTLTSTKNFAESSKGSAETQETVGYAGSFDGQSTYLIDTPGMGDAKRTDAPHLVQMAQFVTSSHEAQAFVIVLNYYSYRFGDEERRLFELVRSMFPNSRYYEHIGVVWTHFNRQYMDPDLLALKDERKEEFKKFFKEYIEPSLTPSQLNAIPQFFVDSVRGREITHESYAELRQIVVWASSKPKLHQALPQIRVPVGEPKIEPRQRTVNGNTWRVQRGDNRGGRRYGLFGPRSHHPYGDIMQKRTIITEQRIVQNMSDGTQDISDWKEVSRTTVDVVIGSW